ncbi:uncharacterized protein LAESUDRAFT_668561 [Laetiporus sulphureus 93-53]|uniref:Ketoacyl-synt-domain-containing protein n=1 Tax=Laetiporus sulphureus 93-53 TaxID=1314785 RepID=A0A165I7R0_9APHY|nr:uncharacterized protein LAESUDRAFT_668561 [Laetiporus sulphureus 93-53]KZT12695.1 hypothetical protein LAESUDRAFT_668561 [Laetiporus sulphureus 93-53]
MSSKVAIVGISAELPSGAFFDENLDHNAFFDFLLRGGESYERIPPKRFNIEAWKGNDLGKVQTDSGSFLKNIDMFDNVEFGISSRDARLMAPVVKKLLENCFLALLDSGIDYRMKNVGCFTSGNAFDLLSVTDSDEFEARGSFAGYPSMVANRISNHLDLLGPSVPTDTACSSTATALHLAIQAIQHGDCEAAVIAGCQLNVRFIDWLSYSQGHLLSKDGKCKPFDADADGFGRAEACVAIVIKPLEHALRDRDRIYATILGTAINSVGAGGPPGAPVADAQQEAMVQAFKRAGRAPQEVDYVELHATGTAKGDPTEANWVGAQFKREDRLLIGSVKGNIGHTEIAACLASLSKVISILKHRVIPPNVNIKRLNPEIHWDEYNLQVPLEPTVLPCHSGDKYLISLASSGIGGSNGHIVLESPPTVVHELDRRSTSDRGPKLLMAGGLSSRSAVMLSESIRSLAAANAAQLSTISTVLGRRSKQMTWRSYAIVDEDQTSTFEFSSPLHCPRTANPVVFVFSGQGPQHRDMGRQLFNAFPVFRRSVMELDELYKRLTGMSMVNDYGLFGEEAQVEIPQTWPISLILPSIAMFQMSLFDLLVSIGVKPDIVIGHSAGETSVIYASGAAPRSMALELAILRGRAFSSVETLGGTMAALSCSPEDAMAIISDAQQCDGHILEIACYNSPSAVAIAGHEVAIDRAIDIARSRGIFSSKIRTRVPIHSSMMEHCREEYCSGLRELFDRYPGPFTPSVPVYSTLTGKLLQGPFDADYFWRNTRSPILFTGALEALQNTNAYTFIEIAPHPVLSSYISSAVNPTSNIIPTVRRPKRGGTLCEHRNILQLCGQLTTVGHNFIDFSILTGRTCSETELIFPAYPFQKKSFPLYPDTPGYIKQLARHRGPLNHEYLRVNKETHPILSEHIVRGEPIMPAAGFVEMGFEFGATALMNVNFRSILSLSAERPVEVKVKLDACLWTVTSIVSATTRSTASHSERHHADGYLSFQPPRSLPDLDLRAIRNRCPHHVGSNFYRALSYFSAYGPRFRRVTDMYYGADEALVSIRGLDATLSADGNYVLHPAILDACLHAPAFKAFSGDFNTYVYSLPSRVDAVILHRPPREGYFPAHIYAHVTVCEWTPTSRTYNMMIVDDAGRPLCSLRRLMVERHKMKPPPDTSRSFEVLFQPLGHWYQSPDTRETRHKTASWSDPSISAYTEKNSDIRVEHHKRIVQGQPDQPEIYGLNKAHTTSSEIGASKPESQVIATQTSILYGVISSIVSERSRKIVRILILSNHASFYIQISNVLRQFPTLFIEVIVPHIQYANLMDINRRQGIVRPIEANPEMSAEYRKALGYVDVVVSFDFFREHISMEQRFTLCGTILLPGGTLILASRESQISISQGPERSNSESTHFKSIQSSSDNANVSILRTYREPVADVIILQGQKRHHNATDLSTQRLFRSADCFVFYYTPGQEQDLQWHFSGLNTSQELEVWITASGDNNGGPAFGLVRALRREYLRWTIRLVVFPSSYSAAQRQEMLEKLPNHMEAELEIVVTPQNELLVPRLIPLLPMSPRSYSFATPFSVPNTPLNHVVINPRFVSTCSGISAVIGTISNGKASDRCDALVVAITMDIQEEHAIVDEAATCRIADDQCEVGASYISCIPGCTVAILASGLSAYRHPSYLQSLRILLTHADTPIGVCVRHAYALKGALVTELRQDVNLVDLACVSEEPFDLIVSGYNETPQVQILRSLLREGSGSIFLWADERDGIARTLRRDPCSVGEVLQEVLCLLNDLPMDMSKIVADPLMNQRPDTVKQPEGVLQASFNPDRTYLILGGIGNIGVHLALFMYQRGARHIVLTSRRGKQGISESTNLMVRRISHYLLSQGDVDLHFEAVDATSESSMNDLIRRLPGELGGCIVLTAVVRDRSFLRLDPDDFSVVLAAKAGVVQAFQNVVDTARLEFFIAFSSVSGLFGSGGQTNYDCANTALEASIALSTNAFVFVCPGIIDSSLLLAGNIEQRDARFNHLLEWSMSTEEMITWFEDALIRFQSGQRFHCYVPDIEWEAMDRTFGMTKLGKHLIASQTTEDDGPNGDIDHMAGMVRAVLGIRQEDFSPDVPLSAYGIDSLSAAKLSYMLRPIAEISQLQLLADVSVNDLQQRIDKPSSQEPTQENNAQVGEGKAEQMRQELEKHLNSMIKRHRTKHVLADRTSPHVVLLTGSTGALGSHILFQLLNDENVQRVYALNRRHVGEVTLQERQFTAYSNQGLPVDHISSPKLTLLEADLTAEDLGLDTVLFRELASSVTHIIHNAWMIDFYSPLPEFAQLIKGTLNLLNLSALSMLAVPPVLSFISTIGVYRQSSGGNFAPEEPIVEARASIQTGYIESKWVTERLVQIAGERFNLRTNIIRVGLLSGSINGAWDTSHWVPALVQSAAYLGCLPEGHSSVSWIPVNLAAAAIADLRDISKETLHVIHPRPATWMQLMEHLSTALDVPLVPYEEWFARLESISADSDSSETDGWGGDAKSALRLLDFFRQAIIKASDGDMESMGLLPLVAADKGMRVSPSLMDRSVKQLGYDDVQNWVGYWRRTGFLSPCRQVS